MNEECLKKFIEVIKACEEELESNNLNTFISALGHIFFSNDSIELDDKKKIAEILINSLGVKFILDNYTEVFNFNDIYTINCLYYGIKKLNDKPSMNLFQDRILVNFNLINYLDIDMKKRVMNIDIVEDKLFTLCKNTTPKKFTKALEKLKQNKMLEWPVDPKTRIYKIQLPLNEIFGDILLYFNCTWNFTSESILKNYINRIYEGDN